MFLDLGICLSILDLCIDPCMYMFMIHICFDIDLILIYRFYICIYVNVYVFICKRYVYIYLHVVFMHVCMRIYVIYIFWNICIYMFFICCLYMLVARYNTSLNQRKFWKNFPIETTFLVSVRFFELRLCPLAVGLLVGEVWYFYQGRCVMAVMHTMPWGI